MSFAPPPVLSESLWHFDIWNSDSLEIVLPNDFFNAIHCYHANGYACLTDQPCTIVRASYRFFKGRIKPTNTPFGAPSLKVMRNFFWHGQMLVEPVKLCVEFSIEPWLVVVGGDVFGGTKKAAFNQARWMHQRRDKSYMHGVLRDALAARSLNSVFGLPLTALRQRQATANGRLRCAPVKPKNMARSKLRRSMKRQTSFHQGLNYSNMTISSIYIRLSKNALCLRRYLNVRELRNVG
jgi:hypothetical protein